MSLPVRKLLALHPVLLALAFMLPGLGHAQPVGPEALPVPSAGANAEQGTPPNESASSDSEASISDSENADAAPPAAADDVVRFNIWEFVVKGNTVLPQVEIEKAVYPFLGEGRTVDDVFAAEAALNRLYRQAGFVTVQVFTPEQSVDDGVVMLEVLEAKVGLSRVEGARFYDVERVRDAVPALESGEVPEARAFQEQVAALNSRSPDRRVTAELAPGIREGTVDAKLIVEDKLPLHGNFELNDRFSRDTKRLRSVTNLSYGNLWQREHTIGMSLLNTPQELDQTRVISLNYAAPLTQSDTLFGYFVDSSSNVAAFNDTGSVGIIGTGNVYGLRWIHLMPPAGEVFNSLTFGVDYKDFEDTVAAEADGGIVTPISYFKGIASYSALMITGNPEVRFSVDANVGFRTGKSIEDEFLDKRFRANANFAFLTSRLSGLYRFDPMHAVSLRLDGQLTEDALISNEQFSLGGVDSVRGYLASQVLTDYGFSGSLEYRLTPNLNAYLKDLDWIGGPQAIAFVDGAMGSSYDPLPGVNPKVRLASGGFGFVSSARRGLDTAVYLAWPFIANQEISAGDSRIHFRVGMKF